MANRNATVRDHFVAVAALITLSVAFHGLGGAVHGLGSGVLFSTPTASEVGQLAHLPDVYATEFGSFQAPSHMEWGRTVLGVSGLQ
ncbi:MAG: hypothetical protein ACPGOY_09915 [Rhodospirillaceae bacterium]